MTLSRNGAKSGFPDREEVTLHGHRVSYRQAGSGPLVVLIHGITSTSDNWREVMPRLAENHTVVAPDLLGHGESAKPRGDYSMGAYASGVRDLLAVLGFDKATVVGHSLGGGVAMQVAYQFPERVERLALISTGGLGRSVHPLLRAAALPGSEWVLPVIAEPRLVDFGASIAAFFGRFGLQTGPDVAEFMRGYASLADRETRAAFIYTLRASIDPGGQRASALDRLYLAASMPTMLIWGERDPVIPVHHGQRAHELIAGSELHVLPDAGHFPHLDDSEEVAALLSEFIDSTEPAETDDEELRERLLAGSSTPEEEKEWSKQGR